MTADRADFVAKLFSRRRPAQLSTDASVGDIFQAFASVPADPELAEQHLKNILAHLKTTHRFALSDDDEKRIREMYLMFVGEGVTRFRFSQESPGYTRLMIATDANGRNWSYLASQENYDRVRTMHQKNLIVPLVGDFAGPKAVRMAGQYLRDHGAVVNVFYISNVEDYIHPQALQRVPQSVWDAYAANIASLPTDSSSLFVRWTILFRGTLPSPWLASIADFVRTGDRKMPPEN
jgi:hypothetical protein